MHLMHLLIGSYSCILTPPPTHCPAVMHLIPTPLRVYIYNYTIYHRRDIRQHIVQGWNTYYIYNASIHAMPASQPPNFLHVTLKSWKVAVACMSPPGGRQLLGYNNIAIMPLLITSFSMLPPSLPSPSHHPIPTLKAYNSYI